VLDESRTTEAHSSDPPWDKAEAAYVCRLQLAPGHDQLDNGGNQQQAHFILYGVKILSIGRTLR